MFAETRMLASIGIVVLLGYAVFEALLAFGAPLGRYAWGGQHEVLPTGLRIASAIATLVYGALAVLLARAVGLVGDGPVGGAVRTTVFVAAGFMALGVPLNLLSRSAPERFHAVGALLLAVTFFTAAR